MEMDKIQGWVIKACLMALGAWGIVEVVDFSLLGVVGILFVILAVVDVPAIVKEQEHVQ
jgi:hypothetical protein